MVITEVTSLHILQTKNNNKECYGQLCTHGFDNLNEMGQFLGRNNLPKLKEGQI